MRNRYDGFYKTYSKKVSNLKLKTHLRYYTNRNF